MTIISMLAGNYITIFCLSNTWLGGYSISIISCNACRKSMGKKSKTKTGKQNDCPLRVLSISGVQCYLSGRRRQTMNKRRHNYRMEKQRSDIIWIPRSGHATCNFRLSAFMSQYASFLKLMLHCTWFLAIAVESPN